MKRFKNLTIGGIQSKVFNLILFTVFLLTAAYMAVSMYHSNMLARLADESGETQQAQIGEIAGAVMDEVVSRSLERSNRMEAHMADEIFDAAADRVAFLADRAAMLFDHPEDYAPVPCAGPDPKDDGVWKAKVIYADGVDPNDPEVAARVGLLGNLSETMISLCPSFGAANAYIALPEGAHLSVSDTSSSWFVDGRIRSYDPRERAWYRQAVEAEGLIFTEGEWDANTGAYCLECAMPVCGPDGSLRAVVGTDLYLDALQAAMRESTVEGECNLLINREGAVVLSIGQSDPGFMTADGAGPESPLQRVVSTALEGGGTGVSLEQLGDRAYYVVASPVERTGWALVSAFDQAVSGQPTALLQDSLAQTQEAATAVYREKTTKYRRMTVVLLVAVILLTLGGSLVLGRRIVKPLNTITRRVSGLREGDLEFKMEDAYRTGDEVEELAEAFAAISHKTVTYMNRLVKVTSERERLSTELTLAKEIQASMLPHIFPAFPDRPEFDIYASMDPAKAVGGDFYDYFLVDDDHLCMVMADVSGKGVPAALFMMASKIILQSVAMLGKSPAEILARTNEAVCSNNEAEMFVTVWLGILELSTGRLTAANAGHEFPALKKPNGEFELYRDRHGFVIGGMDGVRYQEYEIRMAPGSMLFVYTDGVPEATDADQELFGTDRMVEALNAQPDASPEEVLKNVRHAVDGFVKNAEQFDDLTMLCMTYRGK